MKYCQWWGEGRGQCILAEGHDGAHQFKIQKRLTRGVGEIINFPGNKCPDCGSMLFNPGPRGGMAHNIRCAGCGSKFWFSPPFPAQRLLDSDDVFYVLTIEQPLDDFERPAWTR